MSAGTSRCGSCKEGCPEYSNTHIRNKVNERGDEADRDNPHRVVRRKNSDRTQDGDEARRGNARCRCRRECDPKPEHRGVPTGKEDDDTCRRHGVPPSCRDEDNTRHHSSGEAEHGQKERSGGGIRHPSDNRPQNDDAEDRST